MPVGCLVIDEIKSGENALSGLAFSKKLRVYPYIPRAREPLREGLQALLHRMRSERGAASILARGTGCGAALALAEQLPVERLVLLEPEAMFRRTMIWERFRGEAAEKDIDRQARRLCAFARRNLSLCVADALVVEAAESRGHRLLAEGGLGAHGRLLRLSSNDAEETRQAIERFLCVGEG